MDKNHVDRCVVIADSWPESEIGSTDELVELFLMDENIFIVGGISPCKNFSEQLKKLDEYLNEKKIVGVKLYTGHEEFYLTDDRLKDVFGLAIRYHVPVLFHSGWDNAQYGDADIAEAVLREYPDLQLVCCHCWYPEISKCRKLIKYPNLAFDLSSVADDADVLDRIKDDVKLLIESVPDRVMFGSDSFGCSMEAHIRFIKDLDLPEETECKVLAENARRIYALPTGC